MVTNWAEEAKHARIDDEDDEKGRRLSSEFKSQ